MAKGFIFKNLPGIWCVYHSQDKVLENPELLEKVVKISKKDLADCPGCQQSTRDAMRDWCRIL
ncbi:hypothetical protein HY212_00095 [Candidatus Pacearchaeota archaeon]|nr:hypothetical protein [Candidatus Pacearchaeota archaeon]